MTAHAATRRMEQALRPFPAAEARRCADRLSLLFAFYCSKAGPGQKESRDGDGLGRVALGPLLFTDPFRHLPQSECHNRPLRFVGASGPCRFAVVCPLSPAALTQLNNAKIASLFFFFLLGLTRDWRLSQHVARCDQLTGWWGALLSHAFPILLSDSQNATLRCKSWAATAAAASPTSKRGTSSSHFGLAYLQRSPPPPLP